MSSHPGADRHRQWLERVHRHARLCGLARQNVNRALHKLEEAGLLRISYGVIEVLDVEGLQNFSRGL